MEQLAVGNSRIDEDDDRMYQDVNREIERVVDAQTREVTPMMLKKLMCEPLAALSIDQVTQEFACSICQDSVKEPMVIKHCLHFFCKRCIDEYILRFKKECPLCKCQLRTKRETRFYDKLRKIMGLLSRQIIQQSDK